MIPLVILEDVIARLTRETFLKNREWHGKDVAETTLNGVMVTVAKEGEAITVKFEKYAGSWGFLAAADTIAMAPEHPVYRKADELHMLASEAARRNVEDPARKLALELLGS